MQVVVAVAIVEVDRAGLERASCRHDQTFIGLSDDTGLAQGCVQRVAMDHGTVADFHLAVGRRRDFSNREWKRMNANKRLLISAHSRFFRRFWLRLCRAVIVCANSAPNVLRLQSFLVL